MSKTPKKVVAKNNPKIIEPKDTPKDAVKEAPKAAPKEMKLGKAAKAPSKLSPESKVEPKVEVKPESKQKAKPAVIKPAPQATKIRTPRVKQAPPTIIKKEIQEVKSYVAPHDTAKEKEPKIEVKVEVKTTPPKTAKVEAEPNTMFKYIVKPAAKSPKAAKPTEAENEASKKLSKLTSIAKNAIHSTQRTEEPKEEEKNHNTTSVLIDAPDTKRFTAPKRKEVAEGKASFSELFENQKPQTPPVFFDASKYYK